MPPTLRTLKIAAAFLFLPATLLIFAGAQGQSGKPPADPHASGKLIPPPNTSEVTYCDGCHKDGCPTRHPELVTLSWPAQGKVVLGVRGEVTCGSCHTRGFRRLSDAFLGQDQKRLCNPCHYGQHALPDAHTLTGNGCDSCHLTSQTALAHATPQQAVAMKPNTDSECLRCHYDGPVTHPVGMKNTKKKAPDLPLSSDGDIMCVTCHIGHNQQDRFGDMLRKSNRHGELCLSCHDDL